MQLSWTLVVALLVHKSVFAATPRRRSYSTHNYYVVEHVPRDSGASLADVARALGVEVVERVGDDDFRDHWLVRREKPTIGLSARSADQKGPDPVLTRFQDLQQKAGSPSASRSEDGNHARTIVSSVRYLSLQTLHQRYKRAPVPITPSLSPVSTVAAQLGIHDPMFTQQWHIVNNEYPMHSMNVVPLWKAGITGEGVISSIVDDGLDYESEDLAKNFAAEFSYDFNDHVPLPYPKKAHDRHGTRCAGQIAAGVNGYCGVGIAYDSKVAAVRILSSPISDVDEAAALNYGYQNVSVYSCSWGPRDNGESMGAPPYLVSKAVLNGINNGRGGKGSIFVFASGNGGAHSDQCNFDGYTNSIYSVTVGAVDYRGRHPWYSEACAANMIVAYSSGGGKYIVTTDRGRDQCAINHGGTSAAAPNAAGVFVLALQVRPDLTWRDIQYLALKTAKVINSKDPDWESTATGQQYSYKYGYGLLDGDKFVTAARKWKLVKPQAWFDSPTVQLEGGKMDVSKKYIGGMPIGSEGARSKITITQDMLKANNFESLEHVTIQVWIDHTRRGDVEVELVSPRGIKSVLARMRPGDDAKTGFPGWVFMTVKHWGENPVGDWTIRVSDQNLGEESGRFLGWKMKFWGTTIDPSRAEKYSLPHVDNVLPPVNDPDRPVVVVPTTTQHHSKPTDYLNHDQPTWPKPAISNSPSKESDNDGLISDMSKTFKSHKTFVSGAGVLILIGFLVGAILFFRRRARSAKSYTAIQTNDHQMATIEARQGLRSPTGPHPQERVVVGLGFHSSFLDDDDLSTAGTQKYRDVPENENTTSTGQFLPIPEVRVSNAEPR